MSEQNQKCPRCHTREAEWDPKQGGSRHAYVADVTRCVGCEVIDMTHRDLNEGSQGRDLHGVRVGLIPNDDLDDDAEDAA